ncbi:Transcription factor iws1 [Pleurotus pulmonarius]|nr:Transcription factor iws1 [Pleurotus pulmonarius]KAF4597577.1 Transcription factor iws1 [Pleurotus pulmonarius]
MQVRRPSGVTPLAIVLPHPPLPRRRSSLLSATSISSPRTPSCGSPKCSTMFFNNATNRKSTDSWNSSNADDCEWEWKPEQTLLLSRTLDALPAHLLTPFNGPVPPSNLLDKVARGVCQSKGPVEWPHSIRATRVKLLEVAKSRAKEEMIEGRKVIAEESECDFDEEMPEFHEKDVLQPTTNIQRKRPLYRQSSMDFINNELKDNERNRLPRPDRLFRAFHPYTPNRSSRLLDRSSSPPPPGAVPSLINPSTPSSSTLNSLNSISMSATARPRALRRSTSTSSSMSSISSSSGMFVMADPRIQRMRKADTASISSNSGRGSPLPCLLHTPLYNRPLPQTPDLMTPPPQPSAAGATHRTSAKRAPSFGALAQEVRTHGKLQALFVGGHKFADSTSRMYPSSDEEEKIRSRSAKKVRTRTGAADANAGIVGLSPSPMSTPSKASKKSTESSVLPVKAEKVKSPKAPKTDAQKSKLDRAKGQGAEKLAKASPADGAKSQPSRPRPMNVQRNPSILGAELPALATSPTPVSTSKRENRHHRSHSASTQASVGSLPRSPGFSSKPPGTDVHMHIPAPLKAGVPVLQPPPTQKVRTLRRVRRLAPARKISFGSLTPGDGADGDVDGEGDEEALGSAFQLK